MKLPFSLLTVSCFTLLLTGVPALTIEADFGGGTFISVGEEWRYLKGSRAPSSPADAWQQNGFSDDTWEVGPSGFGYSDGDDATPLNDMEDNYVTVYIRKEFSVPERPGPGDLELVIDYDDGFVAYLNGTEVARSPNMPSGTPTFETTNFSSHEAGTPVTFILGPAADLLHAGTNVLAIEGHNATLSSSDFSLIPVLRTASSITRNGSTLIVDAPELAIGGTVDSPAAHSVQIAGSPASFDPGSGSWSGNAALVPGMNHVTVSALDSSSAAVETASLEIIYVPAAHNISGQVSASATWSGAYLLEGTVTVPAGVVLSIAPGTVVLMKPGATLEVTGQLLADGTELEPVTFTHYGDGTTWERLIFIQAEDSRLRHCVIEFSDCEGDHKDYYDDDCNESTPPPGNRTYFQAVVALGCHLDIEDCLFQNLPDDSSSAEGDALAIISDDPDLPPAEATANIRRCRFIGIGQGVHTRYAYVLVEDSFFTGHNGDNDDIDLYGESTPPPLIQKNILINPGHDDMINPTRCSAILIGNIVAGSDDHGIVLRDKCSPILINNLIYNCSAAGISVQNQCDALLINNTIVDCGRGVRFFDHTNRRGPPYCLFPGSGKATLINCIIRDCPTPFDLEDSPWPDDRGSHATVEYCNIEGGVASSNVSTNSTLTWGPGNIDVNPLFVDAPGGDFRLGQGSLCIDAGTDVSALVANLASLVTDDFDGLPRPLDGDGDGQSTIDLGAHELLLPTADSNQDGIPDGWYHRHGLNPTDPDVALANPDHDPQSTGQEWIADTDPLDGQSHLRLSGVTLVADNSIEIQFPSSENRLYSLLESANLLDWTLVPGMVDIPGSGGIRTLSDSDPGLRKFYRVQVKLP